MKLHVCASSSAGNAYILESSTSHRLLIECGIPFKELQRELGWNSRNLDGCVVSHEHKDHSLSIKDFCSRGTHCFAHESVGEMCEVTGSSFFHPIMPQRGYKIGEYRILTLPVVHDVPCLAFVISHPEMGNLLFVTDTMMLEYTIPKLNHILIECNYSDAALEEAIEQGRTSTAMRQRLLQTHMELETTIGVLQANDLSRVSEIVLLHLSHQNSDSEEFIRRVQKTTGKPTYVAQKGLELELTNI